MRVRAYGVDSAILNVAALSIRFNHARTGSHLRLSSQGNACIRQQFESFVVR